MGDQTTARTAWVILSGPPHCAVNELIVLQTIEQSIPVSSYAYLALFKTKFSDAWFRWRTHQHNMAECHSKCRLRYRAIDCFREISSAVLHTRWCNTLLPLYQNIACWCLGTTLQRHKKWLTETRRSTQPSFISNMSLQYNFRQRAIIWKSARSLCENFFDWKTINTYLRLHKGGEGQV